MHGIQVAQKSAKNLDFSIPFSGPSRAPGPNFFAALQNVFGEHRERTAFPKNIDHTSVCNRPDITWTIAPSGIITAVRWPPVDWIPRMLELRRRDRSAIVMLDAMLKMLTEK